jgi:predicted RNA-binding protein YlqC (UPF0109 family)
MASQDSPAALIEFIAKGITTNPDAIAVREGEGDRVLLLDTAPEDRGRVIGRQGRVAKAMRAVLGASRHGADWRLDIVD